MVILDAVLNIELPDNFHPFTNDVNRLLSLAAGMNALYRTVKEVESRLHELGETRRDVIIGPGPLSVHDAGLLECSFHWYSVSICNYVGGIAFIGEDRKVLTPSTRNNYRKEVCGAAKTFRDKVSAHFSRHYPHPDDNEVDLLHSVINGPALIDGRYRTGQLSMTKTKNGKSTTTQYDTDWSLTEMHESLESRFGPSLCFTRRT